MESVHGQAPDANVRFVAAASCTDPDLLSALAYIVDNHLASIVSDSWSEPADDAALVSAYDQVFEVGAIEGIGFFFSSGDSGYEDPGEDPASDKIQADYPHVQPLGYLGRRNQPRHRPDAELRVRDLLGHPARPAGPGRQVVAVHAAG